MTLAAAVALMAPAAASADTTTSGNWSGYAVHRTGVSFRKVSAHWRQPSGTCLPGHSSYSAFWVGIGGYSLASNALEQVGSELDCTASGQRRMSVWYELVPKASRTIPMSVGAGDELSASVRVAGDRVTISLADLTRHESFTRKLTDHHTDTGSAEWIAEAPSNCSSATSCLILRLADFGSVGFTRASAVTTRHRSGSISSALWGATKIMLGPQGHQSAAGSSSGTEASPSTLRGGGHNFSVAYTGLLGGSGGSGGLGTLAGVRSLTRDP